MKNTKLLCLVVLIVAFVWGILSFWDVLSPFLVAFGIAFLLTPLARLLERKSKIPYALCVAIVLLVFLLIVATALSQLIPYGITQVSLLVSELSLYGQSFDALVTSLTEQLATLGIPSFILDELSVILLESDGFLSTIFGYVLSLLVDLSLGLFDVVVIFIVTIYLMLDGRKLVQALRTQLPPKLGPRLTHVLDTSSVLTWRYFRTRVLISCGMGIVTYIGLSIMGLNYALLFAIMSFILDFIPYFGSIIAGIIESIYALIVGGLGLALIVAVFVLIVQQIEGNVVAPKLQGYATGVHPITIMFALLACNQIWGPIGMLISTPVAVVIKIIFLEIYHYIIDPDTPPTAPPTAQSG